VSGDAHQLDRDVLRRKDREQLVAIAAQLGLKAPARARKDQIIDLIVGDAGPSDAPSTAGGEAPAVPADRLPFADRAATGPEQAPAASPPRPAFGDAGPGADTGVATPASGAAATPAQASATAPAATASAPSPSSPTGRAATTFSPFGDHDAPAFRRTPPPTVAGVGGSTAAPASGPDAPARPVGDRPERDSGDRDRNDRDRNRGEGPGAGAGGPGPDRFGNGNRDGNGGGGDGNGGGRDRGDDADGGDDDGGDRGDGFGEREGGGRRRRRRGRDKDRGDRPAGTAVPGAAPAQQPDRTDRPDRGDRPDRSDRPDRGDRPDRSERGDHGPRSDRGDDGGSESVPVSGHLDLRDEGYGFLRVRGYLASRDDVYVPAKFVRQYGLRKGDHLSGASRPAARGEKNPALLRVDEVNGGDPDAARNRPRFEDLTPLYPDQKLRLERVTEPNNMTARIIDLIAPIGKGQRGLIVSPPKAGKTSVMKTIAQCIEANNPEVKLIVLLVDERPEEVTDMRRSVKGEVVASTFDRPADEHTHVAEMTIERAKRLVEQGEDVVVILDGITRLARAYNLAAPATGRVMSGGIDTGALYPPKKFFGAARNVEEGGSLTILATALVETGSRMDEVIFEEFKGTGNMELRLDRRLAEKRVYPAIDVDGSSTRHEELLFDRRQLNLVWKLRRVLSGLAGDGAGAAALELLVDRMRTFRSNDEFLAEIAKAP
jgi:transcription termination factor Rho